MIKILEYTTKQPLEMIGRMAGICWHSPVDDYKKNVARAIECIASGHGRVEEFPDVYISITGYSARCLRELYTHIGGSPTRLQSSTRYVNCSNFEYYNPATSYNNEELLAIYEDAMKTSAEFYDKLLKAGMSKEDAANVLPLGMHSEMVWKVNLRTLINFFNQRLCKRAYKEIRLLTVELANALADYSPEWRTICKELFVPKCKVVGYCIEGKSCGAMPRKSQIEHKDEDDLK